VPDRTAPVSLVVPVLGGNLFRQLGQSVLASHWAQRNNSTGHSHFDLVSFSEAGLNQKGLGKPETDAIPPTTEPDGQLTLLWIYIEYTL
jgi:hypothetical protein